MDRMHDHGAPPGAAIEDGPRLGTARDRLRRETRDLHDAAEAAFGAAPFTSRAAYAVALVRLRQFHRAMEAALAPHLPVQLIDGLRADLGRLDRDIRHLTDHAAPDDAAAGAAPPPAPTPTLEGAAQAFGGLYVVEGARLGGRVLARQAQARLGLDAAAGASFLAGGADGGARWRAFLRRLEAATATEAARGDAAAGARAAFALFLVTCTPRPAGAPDDGGRGDAEA